MKKYLLTALLVGSLAASHAQVVQWASKVLEFSSELTPVQYSSQQALGKPNVLPGGGQNPNAWVPDRPQRKEFIKVGFDTPMNIRQIAIAESDNPSAIYRVLVYDEGGLEYPVNTLNPQAIPLKGRMLNLFMDPTPYKVVAVKIEFDGAALPGYFAIDAIGISDSQYPIIADIPQPQLLASGLIIEPLSENVNSEVDDLNPLLSPDGKTLYFSRRNFKDNTGGEKDLEDIWYSELDSSGNWQLAKNLTQFNNPYPNFINTITSISPDGKSAVMVLGNKYLDNGKMEAGVSVSTYSNGVWSKPKALNITNDYNMNEKANYFLTNDRKTLLMSVEREDSFGDRDIYVSFAGADSVWSEPVNLGQVINSAGEESAPFLATDNETLYFSSNGFSGYGGSDIYMSKRLDNTWTNWSDPENLGAEINSSLEDLFFNIPASSEYAYYSRGVSENNTDIFRVKLPIFKEPQPWIVVRGKVVDASSGDPVSANIIFERLPGGDELDTVATNPATGEYEIRVPGGHLYGVRAQADNLISESQNLDLRDMKKDGTVDHRDFGLEPIKVTALKENATIALNNVFFEFNSADLKSESFPELDRIADLIKEKESMQIAIAGHTDNVGPDSYNLQLSKRRANAVSKYLMSKGVSKKTIKTEFYGEKNPIESNDTEEGRSKNRRVEFKILKI